METADGAVHRGPQLQVALKALPPQVDVAVAQAHVLIHPGAGVQRERRGVGGRQNLYVAVADLNLTGVQLGVDRALGPGPHRAADADHVFRAQIVALVNHALDHAGTIPQVDEGQVLPVLSAAVHPAAHRYLPANVIGAQLAAIVSSHRGYFTLSPASGPRHLRLGPGEGRFGRLLNAGRAR